MNACTVMKLKLFYGIEKCRHIQVFQILFKCFNIFCYILCGYRFKVYMFMSLIFEYCFIFNFNCNKYRYPCTTVFKINGYCYTGTV
jgi:hypothetical protein